MTAISWCVNPDGTPGETWNPIRARNRVTGKRGWYCEPVHLGCKYCYAGDQNAKRGDSGGTGLPYKPGHRGDVEIYLDEKTLRAPLHWRKPRTIFPCSMTDLYGPWVPDPWLHRIKAVQAITPQHTYIELTKRPKRRREYLSTPEIGRHWFDVVDNEFGLPELWEHNGLARDLVISPNVWGAASCSTQPDLDEFAPDVLRTPLAKRGLSLEPLLGEVDLYPYLSAAWTEPVFDFVIVGGLNGPGPTDIGPIRSVVRQCQAAGVPVFVKQLGTRPFETGNFSAWPDHIKMVGDGFGRYLVRGLTNRKGENPDDWPEDLRVRDLPWVTGRGRR